MDQLMAIVAVCRLAILKRMPATPLTLLVAHRLRDRTSESASPENILPKFYLSFWTTCPYKEPFRHCFVTERKGQREVRQALKAINHRAPRGN
ncbi:unnamed protein product, partial [Porites lobata]